MRELVERCARVATARHHRRACVILLAAKDESNAAQSHDARYDADAKSGILQMRPLFDMRLDKAGITIARETQPRDIRQACIAQSVRQRHAMTVLRVLFHFRCQCANQRAAAEATYEARLFVLERHRVYR